MGSSDWGSRGYFPVMEQRPSSTELPEPDPVIERYKQDLDRTLLRENLRRTVAERLANLVALQRLAFEARRSGGRR